MTVSHNRCPYTLEQLAKLAEVNDEHIFPDAIGGAKDYSVRVDSKSNSDLGSMVDAPLIKSFLIAGLRLQHGIKSRSGAPQWKLNGELTDSGRKVQVVFSENADVEVHIHKPVEMEGDSNTGKLILQPDQRDSFLKQFVENHQKKGRSVVVSAESTTKASDIQVPIEVDFLALKRAMAKIAFLAVYECVGDAFLDDPMVPEWHRAFLTEDPNEACNAQIHGVAFDAAHILDLAFPPLKPYEHAVFVANLRQQGLVVGVTLFGTGFHSLIAIASETCQFGLDVGEGTISICDAKAGKTRTIDFVEHLVDTANRVP